MAFSFIYFASGFIVIIVPSVPMFPTLSTHEFSLDFYADRSGTVNSAPQRSNSRGARFFHFLTFRDYPNRFPFRTLVILCVTGCLIFSYYILLLRLTPSLSMSSTTADSSTDRGSPKRRIFRVFTVGS